MGDGKRMIGHRVEIRALNVRMIQTFWTSIRTGFAAQPRREGFWHYWRMGIPVGKPWIFRWTNWSFKEIVSGCATSAPQKEPGLFLYPLTSPAYQTVCTRLFHPWLDVLQEISFGLSFYSIVFGCWHDDMAQKHAISVINPFFFTGFFSTSTGNANVSCAVY